MSHKELRTTGVFTTIDHAECAGEMVSNLFAVAFTRDLVTRIGCSRIETTARLGIFSRPNCKKGEPIVILFFNQVDKITNCLWRVVFVKFDDKNAFGCFKLDSWKVVRVCFEATNHQFAFPLCSGIGQSRSNGWVEFKA